MHRAPTTPQVTKFAVRLAELAGRATRSIPGVGGALLVCWGVGQIYGPLLYVSLGGFLLLADRQVP